MTSWVWSRFDRIAEGLEVRLLLTQPQSTFEGAYYQLNPADVERCAENLRALCR